MRERNLINLRDRIINNVCFLRKGKRGGNKRRNGGIAFRTRNIWSLVTRGRKIGCI